MASGGVPDTREDLRGFGQYHVRARSEADLIAAVRKVFDLRPAGIIKMLNLKRPIYEPTAAYGHFGRTDVELPWEQLDKVEELKKVLG